MLVKDEILTISEACKLFQITRQAILFAIKNKRLNAVKSKGKWTFGVKDWQEYEQSRYDRRFSIRNGKHLYDVNKGILSPCMVAKEFDIDTQHIYYLIRKGIIPFSRKGSAYILKRSDMIKNNFVILKVYAKKLHLNKRSPWK